MTKIPTFVRIWVPNDIRLGMSITTVARLAADPDCDLHLVVCRDTIRWNWEKFTHKIFELDPDHFCRDSIALIEAESSGSDIYCGSDDDMLVYGKNFIARGAEILRRNEEFGLLCATPVNEQDAAALGRLPDITESHAVGGCGFVRRGLIREYPDLENQYYSVEVHRQMVLQGFKQGWLNRLLCLHLGQHFSFSSPAHFDGL